MPFSSESGKAYTKKIIEKLVRRHDSSKLNVLDVGVGSGTYSTLFRNIIPGRWAGVEIWKPYVEKYKLHEKYDELIIGDIRLLEIDSFYDIAFVGDILEHMTLEEAKSVIKKLAVKCSVVIVSIPIIKYPQGEYDGNPHEAHIKDDWSDEEVRKTWGDLIFDHEVENEIGVYILTIRDSIRRSLHPHIAVYGIFKNEAQFAERFLKSCIDADEVVLCDTGSTDNTIEIFNKVINEMDPTKSWAKVRIEKITVLPWRFDDARNAALSFVSPDIDLCVSLDLDEWLQPGWKFDLIREYDESVTRYYHRFCTYWDSSKQNKAEHWHDRIHTRQGYKWALPVHEIIEPYGKEEKIKWLHNWWMYQQPDLSKPRSSYLPLLEVSVRERPDVWKSWSFLASEYYTNNRPQDALNALDKALAIEKSDKSFLHNFRATVYNHMEQFDNAVASMRMAIAQSPNVREYQVYLAEMYEKEFKKTGNGAYLTFAKMHILIAESITGKMDGYVYNPNCWDDKFNEIKHRIISNENN